MMCCWLISQARNLCDQKRLGPWCDIFVVTMHNRFRGHAYRLMEAGLHDRLFSDCHRTDAVALPCYNLQQFCTAIIQNLSTLLIGV